MKALFTTLLLFIASLSFAQINPPSQTPPLVSLTGVPYDIAFELQGYILDDEKVTFSLKPRGDNKILFDAIQSKVDANGALAGSKTYTINNIPFKYFSKIVIKIIEENPYQAMKRLERFGRKKQILKQIKLQNPMIIRQILESNRSSINGNAAEVDTLLNN